MAIVCYRFLDGNQLTGTIPEAMAEAVSLVTLYDPSQASNLSHSRCCRRYDFISWLHCQMPCNVFMLEPSARGVAQAAPIMTYDAGGARDRRSLARNQLSSTVPAGVLQMPTLRQLSAPSPPTLAVHVHDSVDCCSQLDSFCSIRRTFTTAQLSSRDALRAFSLQECTLLLATMRGDLWRPSIVPPLAMQNQASQARSAEWTLTCRFRGRRLVGGNAAMCGQLPAEASRGGLYIESSATLVGDVCPSPPPPPSPNPPKPPGMPCVQFMFWKTSSGFMMDEQRVWCEA